MAASWPPAAATDATLSVAVNSLQTTLSSGIDNVVTSIPLTSTSGFPTAGFVTIDNEVISYTGVSGGNLTGAVRGADGTSAAAHLAAAPVSATIVAAHHNSLKDEVKAIEGDLVNVIGAITPASAASTAATLYARFQHLTNQIKTGFGLTNWYDSIANALTSFLLKAGGTMTGSITFSPTTAGIVGTTAADNAAAGGVGEYVESVISSASGVSASNTHYVDVTSISLTAGDWDVSLLATMDGSISTTITEMQAGIGTASGDNASGLLASTIVDTTLKGLISMTVPPYRLSLSSTVTRYFKFYGFYTGTAPKGCGRISARRVR